MVLKNVCEYSSNEIQNARPDYAHNYGGRCATAQKLLMIIRQTVTS